MRSNTVEQVAVDQATESPLLLALGYAEQTGDMVSLDPGLTLLEVLSIAIRAKVEAAQVYDELAQRVTNPTLKEKLLFLKDEEETHGTILVEMYTQNFPEVTMALPPRSPLPKADIALNDDTSLLELLEMAMQWQKAWAEYYATFARRARNVKGKAMLQYLSQMESSHYHMLKRERDFLARFPEDYDAREFHLAEKMFHLGP